MIDEGIGDFLWVKDSKDTSSNVGSSTFGLSDIIYHLKHKEKLEPYISLELLDEFRKWVEYFYKYLFEVESNIEKWHDFNNKGIELSKKLKQEFGNSTNVQYVKYWEDPTLGKNKNKIELFLPA
jgi:hypothetical protein